MKPAALVPRYMMEQKPPYGGPCTRCGACCVVALCKLGQHVFGDKPGPCPALQIDAEKRAHCGLTTTGSEEHKAAARLLIGAGDGCDARFNSEPVNPATLAKWIQFGQSRRKEIESAKRLWGVP